jgi:hypothetical protein
MVSDGKRRTYDLDDENDNMNECSEIISQNIAENTPDEKNKDSKQTQLQRELGNALGASNVSKAPDRVKKNKRADKITKKGDLNSNDNKTDKMDKSAPDQSLYNESRLGKNKKKKDKKSDLGDKKSKSTKNKKDLTDDNSQVAIEKRENKRPKPNYVRPG